MLRIGRHVHDALYLPFRCHLWYTWSQSSAQVLRSLAGGCCPRCWSFSIWDVTSRRWIHVIPDLWALLCRTHDKKWLIDIRFQLLWNWKTKKKSPQKIPNPNIDQKSDKWLWFEGGPWGHDVHFFQMSLLVEMFVTHRSIHLKPFAWRQAEHFSFSLFWLNPSRSYSRHFNHFSCEITMTPDLKQTWNEGDFQAFLSNITLTLLTRRLGDDLIQTEAES